MYRTSRQSAQRRRCQRHAKQKRIPGENLLGYHLITFEPPDCEDPLLDMPTTKGRRYLDYGLRFTCEYVLGQWSDAEGSTGSLIVAEYC